MNMYNGSEIYGYQNVINEVGHPIALVDMVTTFVHLNRADAQYIMVSKIQWKPFRL